MEAGIRFGQGVTWGGISQTELRRMASDSRYALPYRVHWAALARANGIGHAEFAVDELRELLVNRDGKPSEARVTSGAIKRARDLGLVEPESNVRCLVVTRHLFRRAGQVSMSCRTHKVKPLR